MNDVRVGDLVAAPDKKNAGYLVVSVEGIWATVRDGDRLRTFSIHGLRVISRSTSTAEATP